MRLTLNRARDDVERKSKRRRRPAVQTSEINPRVIFEGHPPVHLVFFEESSQRVKHFPAGRLAGQGNIGRGKQSARQRGQIEMLVIRNTLLDRRRSEKIAEKRDSYVIVVHICVISLVST